MQHFFCIGNITRDPELRTTPSGIEFSLFSIAVNRAYNGSDGEKITDFFNCVAWRGIGKSIYQYCKKGSKIAIVGELQNRAYENKDGQRIVNTEINVNRVTFLNYGNQQKKANEDDNIVVSPAQLNLMDDIESDGLPF